MTHDISRYTKARLFGAVGRKTDAFVRFSTVAGERGAADAERDTRGFAVKFYTDEGNWGLVRPTDVAWSKRFRRTTVSRAERTPCHAITATRATRATSKGTQT